MGDGTYENPYTRKDVLRLIRKNGGTADGLDLSGKEFEPGIDLSKLNLNGIILRAAMFFSRFDGKKSTGASFEKTDLWNANLEGASLNGANLKGANFYGANFQRARLHETHLEDADLLNTNLKGAFLIRAYFKGADLWNADLRKADLSYAHLEEADLADTHFEGANLSGVEFSPYTRLEGVDWGNFIMGEEVDGFFYPASDIYRRLKIWHTEHGLYNVAGKFFYREMEASRKAQSWRKPHLKLWYWAMRLLCGYGEKPERVGISAAVVIFGLAAVYYFWGSFSSASFWDTLYYSVASFTALGYGQWAPQTTGWAKGVGAAEAIIGVSMIALFLVTFTRKVSR